MLIMAIDWKAARHLPWGWWLRANGQVLEDMDGVRWHSVRDAFWRGRMNFPTQHLVPEQLELLLRVLSSIERRWVNGSENRHDLFGGDMLFWRFYCCWLASVGLTDLGRSLNALEGTLSDEGHSVMLMLQATRDPAWVDVPMDQVVDTVRSAMLDDDLDREASFGRFEHAVACRLNVFARETVGGRHLVTLTGFQGTGRMPVRRVTWSASFGDKLARDTLFAWLAERVDRWDDWAECAYRDGASALTQRLFTLFLAG
jgi:hypothetical protein